jgi:hypothetical protein
VPVARLAAAHAALNDKNRGKAPKPARRPVLVAAE